VLHEIQLTTEIIPWVTYVNHVATDILNQLQLSAEIIATYVNDIAIDVLSSLQLIVEIITITWCMEL
jgi:hypothetical protein